MLRGNGAREPGIAPGERVPADNPGACHTRGAAATARMLSRSHAHARRRGLPEGRRTKPPGGHEPSKSRDLGRSRSCRAVPRDEVPRVRAGRNGLRHRLRHEHTPSLVRAARRMLEALEHHVATGPAIPGDPQTRRFRPEYSGTRHSRVLVVPLLSLASYGPL